MATVGSSNLPLSNLERRRRYFFDLKISRRIYETSAVAPWRYEVQGPRGKHSNCNVFGHGRPYTTQWQKSRFIFVLILSLPSSVALGGPRWVPGTNLNNTAATDIPSNLTLVNVQKLRLPHCEPQGGHRCSLKPSLVKPPCARSPHAGTSEAWRFDRGRFEEPTVATMRLTVCEWPLCGSQLGRRSF